MNTLQLVNNEHSLNKDFKPQHLIQDSFSKIWLCREVFWAVRRINYILCKLGLEQVVIISGYRSYAYQEKLFMRKIDYFGEQGLDDEAAKIKAAQIVAMPGHSEHQLGLAVDLAVWSMKDLADPLTTDFEQTSTGKWLLQHSHQYGLILRYPKDKVTITQITYEPWHYRYVGQKAARKMYENHWCLEEYLCALKG
ncbi:M15 family metallopeptidase [Cellulosilyticum ruminicola]|uniref:M15 family metallopeptidase n=1 Tax=Cellulosilyticum ruminicola TaxID=425254 RepID=UPI0006D25440|nr:M15 family metallopeptidase [Cellulosilyticum ruminicola]